MLPQNPELFSWLNTLAMLGWALLIIAPKRWQWLLITAGIAIPTIIGLVYGGLMFTHFASTEGAGYGSLIQVKALMANESLLVAGWAHYLCFDLVIGTLIAIEGDKRSIHRLIQIPMLLATFMFGPVGLLLLFFYIALMSLSTINKVEL